MKTTDDTHTCQVNGAYTKPCSTNSVVSIPKAMSVLMMARLYRPPATGTALDHFEEPAVPRLQDRDDDGDDDSDLDDDDDDAPEFGDDEPIIPCPYCGAAIHDESERCHHCGQYLSQEDAPHVRKPWWITIGVAACLYVVYRWIV
jgi:hypothetical protein